MMAETLRPCPFCGSDYVELHGAYRTDRAEVRAWVRCESCGAEMHEYPPRHLVRGIDESTGIVVRHWNSRAENIVRCRDCVHWRRPSDRERSRCTGAMAFVEPNPDGFCAWGRRVVGEDS